MRSTVLSRKGLFLPLVILLALGNMAVMGFWAPANMMVMGGMIILGYALALLFAYLKDGEG